MVRKRLYRSRTNRVLGGICGGLGEYLDIDPTVIRLVWVVIVIFTGIVPGILAYLLLLLIVPEKKS
ncbi:PspC domain-containing protein [Candidatus Woesearchaeota archaeon]|nr:PspC domain-containing protein [Candidatus Woesearchaeota archaeon]